MDGIIGLAFPLSVSLASASSARAVLGHFAAALWRQEQLEQGEAGGRARAAAAAAADRFGCGSSCLLGEEWRSRELRRRA